MLVWHQLCYEIAREGLEAYTWNIKKSLYIARATWNKTEHEKSLKQLWISRTKIVIN